MDEVHYLISDASRKVDVEAHVLRYWEEELELDIPRNEMGHRYYTDLHIRMFKQVKSLKEKGYQLKAIKHALNQVLKKDGENGAQLTDELLEQDMDAALRGIREEERLAALSTVQTETAPVISMEDKMAQFQQIMNLIIGRALEVNNEKHEPGYQQSCKRKTLRGNGVSSAVCGSEGGGAFSSAGRSNPILPEERTGRSGGCQGAVFLRESPLEEAVKR